jgi:hypothetical protein
MANVPTIGISRVYKMSRRARFLSLLCLSLGVFNSVLFLTGALSVTYRHARMMIIGVGALLFGALATAVTFSSRITLSDDAIELRNILEKRRLLISEIRGRREIVRAGREGFTSTWELLPKGDMPRKLSLSSSYAFDEVFYEWLNKIPALEED